MAAEQPPKYLYKIFPEAPPEPFPKEFPLSKLDADDGFVHLSTVAQVPNTADLFFDHASAIWVAKLRFADFSSSTKWEGGFPHLYGNFGSDNLISVQKFDKPDGEWWADVMKDSKWLE